MKTVASPETPPRHKVTLKELIGSGDRIMLFTLPFLIVGVVLQIAAPSFMDVGGPPDWLRAISLVVLAVGVVIWLWAVALILAKVPHGELITTGPYAVMMHPIYTSVALLVLPWLGFLLATALFVLVLVRGLGTYSWPMSIVVTAAIAIACDVVFKQWLGMPLPAGPLGL